jgi:uncharacterized protein
MHLTLHLTAACNMRCDYCYAPPRDGAPMTFDTGCRALEFATRRGSGSCGIVFFGGEPLLCKDLIRRLVAQGRELERRRAGRFHFKVTTSGLLLDEAFLEFALREDLFIAMSVDGVPAVHDRHRRLRHGGPTAELVINRLRQLLAVRPFSSVLMVVNPDTAADLVESVTFLLDAGVRYLVVSMNYAAPWTDGEFEVLRFQLEELGELYIEWTKLGRKFYLSPFEVKLSSHINRHCYQKERCELARRQWSVDPAGYLYPCVQFVKAGPASRWCLGHVESGVDEAKRLAIHDESESVKAVCRTCAIRNRCNNSCGCLNWQATGSINEVSPVLCRYEQMLLPIADRVGRRLYRDRNPLFLHKHYNAAYPVLSVIEEGHTTTSCAVRASRS